MCHACYQKELRAREKQFVCPRCENPRTYGSKPSEGTFKGKKICRSCYIELGKKSGTCPICLKKKNCRWYNIQRGDSRCWAKIQIQIDEEKKSIQICDGCYTCMLKSRENFCIDCRETKTTRWYIHPVTKNRDRCRKCHEELKKERQ